MKLEIVTHCWRYSHLLHYQLSSLFLFPPMKTQVLISIYCAHRQCDGVTADVVDFFRLQPPPPSVAVDVHYLETPRLFRRAIGRNLAARRTNADWIWFTDCDMLFREGALDALSECVKDESAHLLYPRTILIHRTHELGDAAIARANGAATCLDVDAEEFVPYRYRRAIGGVQIVPGAVAREIGYCPEARWQRPADCWQRAREDAVFRKHLGTSGKPIDLPNVFRMRHSQCGREVADLQL